MFGLFSILAIIVTCMGLFGLSTYSVARRQREVGIRKILGAQPGQLMALLSSEYVWLVTAGCLIALPATWFALQAWLSGYAFQMSIGASVFVLPALGVLALTILTVSIQTFRSTRLNPVDAIRSE